MMEPAHAYTVEFGDAELELIRDALQLLLRSDDQPQDIDQIQALLAKLPPGPNPANSDELPTTPWW
ncbi:MAG: hypothetical protein M0Z49_07540 [Chloroflexi bacterium]|nr:hypothetical protein [Chloroflexota bacterium]